MAMRMSGLMSGMDTESVISQLVEARSVKVNKSKKAQIRLNWQQDAWKELNKKLKNLQSKYLGNMRFYSSYSKKTTKVSNESAVSVITGDNAVNGVQSLEINKMAKTGYLTGGELKGADGTKGDYTALTKLSDIAPGFSGSGTFSVNIGKNSMDIAVDENTTISDVLSKLKEAGLNASFDNKSQRFFVSAKESGKAADFSITASDANGAKALSALGLQTNLTDVDKIDQATRAKYEEYASYTADTTSDDDIRANMSALIDAEVAKRTASYEKQYTSLMEGRAAADKAIVDINAKYDSPLGTVNEYDNEIKRIQDELDGGIEGEAKEEAEKKLAEMKAKKADAEKIAAHQATIDKADTDAGNIRAYVNITSEEVDGKTVYHAEAKDTLKDEVAGGYVEKAKFARDVLNGTAGVVASGATKVNGQDAVITLNGAEFTNNTNTFEINGLTFTALSETKPGETVTVTTQNDTDGIYDMVKNYLKEYNSIINEMDKLYNAGSARGYEPLLSEEKEAMSDTEVEEYEKKIKESLLRRDSNLSSISSALKGIMSSGFEVDGKKMYLSDFGINTLGYFNASDNEKNAYHIDGDPDDPDSSGNADKLKGMISSDPETVISFFTQLSQSLYGKMSDLSKSVDGYRSFGSFYDDKKMKSDYDSYTSKISDLEKKLNDYEDKWYAKFSKMETAMAKMQKNANALSGLLGG